VLLGAALACQVDPAALPDMTYQVPDGEMWAAPQLAPPPGPGEGRIYTTNNLDDTVSILDLDAAEAGAPVEVGRVPVGLNPVEREGPHHAAADAAGTHYYVGLSNFVLGAGVGLPHGNHGTGTAPGYVVQMNVDTNRIEKIVRLEPNPGDVRLTPDEKLLLVSHFDLGKINAATTAGITSGPALDANLAVIDVATLGLPTIVTLCPAPHGVGITSDSGLAVISCQSDEVAIVDLRSPGYPVTRLPVLDSPGTAALPTCGPYAITMDEQSDRTTAWVSCYQTGQVIAFDVTGGASAVVRDGRTMQLQGRALFGNAVAGQLVIAHQNTDGITVFDTTGDTPATVSTHLFVGEACTLPHFARWSEGGSIFIVCEGDKLTPGTFMVIDGAVPHAVRGTVELGRFPDDMAIMRRPP
jgi:YVTN family beta-propeller protein